MRPMSRSALARHEAATLAARHRGQEGGCGIGGKTLRVLERAHRRTTDPVEAAQIIEALRDDFCARCPLLVGCADWARVEKYTGLAAGAAYEKGVAQPPEWTVPKPGRQPTSTTAGSGRRRRRAS